MIEIGRVVLKIAGRDAGKAAAIVEVIDSNNVLIDGQTRRRKVNIKHVELTRKTVKIEKGDSTDKVVAALKDAGYAFEEKKVSSKSKEKKTAKPVSKRSQKSSVAKPKPDKKAKGNTSSKKDAKKDSKKSSDKKK